MTAQCSLHCVPPRRRERANTLSTSAEHVHFGLRCPANRHSERGRGGPGGATISQHPASSDRWKRQTAASAVTHGALGFASSESPVGEHVYNKRKRKRNKQFKAPRLCGRHPPLYRLVVSMFSPGLLMSFPPLLAFIELRGKEISRAPVQ